MSSIAVGIVNSYRVRACCKCIVCSGGGYRRSVPAVGVRHYAASGGSSGGTKGSSIAQIVLRHISTCNQWKRLSHNGACLSRTAIGVRNGDHIQSGFQLGSWIRTLVWSGIPNERERCCPAGWGSSCRPVAQAKTGCGSSRCSGSQGRRELVNGDDFCDGTSVCIGNGYGVHTRRQSGCGSGGFHGRGVPAISIRSGSTRGSRRSRSVVSA